MAKLLRERFQLGKVVSSLIDLNLNGHLVVIVLSSQRNEVVGAHFGELHENLLNLNGEDIYSTEHNHIIRTTTHTVDTNMVASTGASTTQNTSKVTGTITQQRHGLTAKGCEHQLANLTIGYRLQSFGVNNLHNVIVLPEVHTILFRTFETYARSAHLTHTEGVIGLHTHHLLDALALFFAVRFCTNSQHLQFGITAWIYAFFLHYLVKTGNIAGNSMDGSGTKIFDELNLAQRVTCSGRNRQHAKFLGSVLESQATGEHTITT